MKIEYMPGGSWDTARPFVRIHDFDESEARVLFDAITTLSNGAITSLSIHRLPQTESVAHCHLTAASATRNIGVSRIRNEENSFLWELTPDTWQDVACFIEPFCMSAHGFQWLDDYIFQWGNEPSRISVLLSAHGEW